MDERQNEKRFRKMHAGYEQVRSCDLACRRWECPLINLTFNKRICVFLVYVCKDG